jgi:hypothetical protein
MRNPTAIATTVMGSMMRSQVMTKLREPSDFRPAQNKVIRSRLLLRNWALLSSARCGVVMALMTVAKALSRKRQTHAATPLQ